MATVLVFPSFLAFALSLLFCNLMPSYATETDIYCLKSVMSSVEDPFGYLKNSWNFRNNTFTVEGFICRFTGVECWHPDENRVLNLRLSDMGLRGSFPLGLANCTSLSGLDLSGNKFSGPIPSDIPHMLMFLTSLNLSSNEFSGEIPATISNCSYLNVLKMDNNRLVGQIPLQLGSLPRLKTFSVANNLLSGKVPVFPKDSFNASSYSGNPGLCGHPLNPCLDKLTKRFPNPFISGFTVGYVVCFPIALVASILLFMPKMQRQKNIPAKRVTMTRARQKEVIEEELRLLPINLSSRSNNTKILKLEKFVTRMRLAFLPRWPNQILKLEKFVRRMSLVEIESATNNFCQDGVIWVGKRGTVHKATLPNGWFLAVKKLYYNQPFEEHFVSEAMVLGSFRHPNLVPLLGFCIEGKERLLVYKYMPNKNLQHWLHLPNQGNSSKIMFLDWPLRLKIAIGVARGLTWLHNNPNIQTLHLNITSKCILLDDNFKPKISNFGNAKFTSKQGADSSICLYPYMELKNSSFVNKDVHDFGMVLFEMITRNEPLTTGKTVSINSCSLLSNDSSGFYDIIDKYIIGRGFDGEIYELLRIAWNCVNPSPDEEPTMLQVFESIRTIGQSQEPRDGSKTWVPSEAASCSIAS